MSHLMKHAMVQGISARLADSGVITWPSEKVAFDVCAKVASMLEGPEMLTSRLDKQSCLEIANMLKAASEELAANGHRPSAADLRLSKQAAALDLSERAALIAEACMSKAAEDASLNNSGTNSPEEAARNDQVAKLDQQNRPTTKYNLGFGRTNLPEAGVVGRQQWVHGSTVSNSLSSLDKQAEAGADPSRIQQLLEALKGVPAQARMMGADMAERIPRIPADLRNAGRGVVQGIRSMPQEARDLGAMAQGLHADGGIDREAMQMLLRKGAPLAGKAALGLGAGTGLGYGAYRAMGGGDDEKQASEDMSAADLGMDPAQRGSMFLHALHNRVPDLPPSEANLRAAAGLGAAGDQGLEVMAAVIENVKTAADADAAIQQILHHQGEAGELASPELVEALQRLLAEEDGGDGGEQGGMDPMLMQGVGKQAAALPAKALPVTGKVPEFLSKHKKGIGAAVAGVSALAAAGMGAKALHDKKKEKSAELLALLKNAANGSLTDVGPNTPGAAAKVDQTAKLDLENRSEDEHNVGQGKTKMTSPGQGYAQKQAPKAEEATVSNSLSAKSAADRAYEEAFRKIAEEHAPNLPAAMSREQKVATLQHLLGMPPGEREGYVMSLYAQ